VEIQKHLFDFDVRLLKNGQLTSDCGVNVNAWTKRSNKTFPWHSESERLCTWWTAARTLVHGRANNFEAVGMKLQFRWSQQQVA